MISTNMLNIVTGMLSNFLKENCNISILKSLTSLTTFYYYWMKQIGRAHV